MRTDERPSFPYRITFIDCEISPAVHEKIEGHLARLGHLHPRIVDAEVMVRIPHRHAQRRFFHIHVRLDLPGRRLAIARERETDDDHHDIQLALRDAFAKVERRLADFAQLRKQHRPRPTSENSPPGEAP